MGSPVMGLGWVLNAVWWLLIRLNLETGRLGRIMVMLINPSELVFEPVRKRFIYHEFR